MRLKTTVTLALLLPALVCMPPAVFTLAQNTGYGDLRLAVGFERQITDYSCGLASLVSVLRYWDRFLDQEDLLHSHPPGDPSRGYTLGELKAIAQEQQLNAYSLRTNFTFLQAQLRKGRTVIVPLRIPYNYYKTRQLSSLPVVGSFLERIVRPVTPEFSHFVTVSGIRGQDILVMDPLVGDSTIPSSDFQTMWSKMDNVMLLVAA